MLQQVMTEPGKIIFREIPVPEIGDGQVLVKIMDIGVCGSDIHVYHGKHPFTKYPVTQGHEVSGEIVKCGANVEGLTVGQKVTIGAAGVLRQVLSVPTRQVQPVRGAESHGLPDDGHGFRIFCGGRKESDTNP